MNSGIDKTRLKLNSIHGHGGLLPVVTECRISPDGLTKYARLTMVVNQVAL